MGGAQADDALHGDAEEPGGRTGIPAPAPAAELRRIRAVDVARGDVGFALIELGLEAAQDGIDAAEDGVGAGAPAQEGLGQHRPGAGMGVEPAVFTPARGIAGDVADVGIHGAIGRGKEERAVLPVEMLLDGGHRRPGAFRRGGAADDRPGLGVEVDPPLRARGAAQLLAAVLGGPPVPVPVPTMLVNGSTERLRLRGAEGQLLRQAGGSGQFCPFPQDTVEEMAHPDRLALHAGANGIESVVPVMGADEGQAARAAPFQSALEGAAAVLPERLGLLVIDERQPLLQKGEIPALLQILGRHKGQPEEVVADAAVQSCIGERVPPVIDRAVFELMAGVKADLGGGLFGGEGQPDQAVLKLIAEAVGPALLVIGGAGPEPA